jgi:CubicO group peptidase (beta-lactamase class C family)
MILTRSITFLAVALVAALPAFAENGHALPTARPESVGMSSARLDRIGERMQWYIDQQLVPGTVTLVARRGKVVHFEARGQRWVEEGQPMQIDSIFRIASMTKPITSVALMMLFEEGKFQLNDPISNWLPEFANMQVAVPTEGDPSGLPYRLEPARRPITVEHVLTHTAGFANSYRNAITMPMHEKISAPQSPDETVADYIARLATLLLNYHPGEKWEYSRATCVVGRLVEVMSGMTLDEFFRERIFKPLGMSDTYFYLPHDKLDRFAANYQPEGDANHIKLVEAPDAESRFAREGGVYFMGSGGLVSTAADYWRFHQMMLNGGELYGVRILGRKTVELMTANHTRDLPIWLRGPGGGFGLGYSVTTDIGEANSMASVGTYGWGGAYCTYFWVDPAEEVVGIVMTQVRPYTHLNIRRDFQNLAMQAIVD